mgnify:CR=1 FL=1|jgi:hypothetical protein
MKEKEYIIDTISSSTLEENGFDSTRVNDEMMIKIASDLGRVFREQVMSEAISEIAGFYNIPEKK